MRDTQQATLHNDVREAILDSAGNLLSRYGYKKMTVDDIAHEAGIGKGTVYLYFPSKEEVALGWFDRSHAHLTEELKSIAFSSLPSQVKIREFLIKRVMVAFDTAQRFIQSLDELFDAVRPSFLIRREKYQANHAAILGEILSEGYADGTFAKTEAESTAHILLLATNSLLPYSLSTSELGRRDEIQARITTLADILLKGLLRRFEIIEE